MALFGSARDVSFISRINKELINDIIDTEIAYYKLVKSENKLNVYGENIDGLYFYNPVLIPTLITREDPDFNEEDHGQDFEQTINFGFLRDTLIDINVVPEIGDIIEHNLQYYEIDNVFDNQFFAGKNPDTAYTGEGFGMNISIIVNGHLTRKSRITGLIPNDYYVGINEKEF